MARVAVYGGGSVQREGVTSARLRAVDNGPSALAVGLQTAGKAGTEYLERDDQIQELHDRNDADRLALEHLEASRLLRQTVREARGPAAETAAQEAKRQLDDKSKELLAQARSPRARRFLEQTIVPRNIQETDAWDAHGYQEFVRDRNAVLTAKGANAQEEATDAADDEAAGVHIKAAADAAEELVRFNGDSDPEVITNARAAATSRAWVNRATKLRQADDPRAAQALLDAHAGEILAGDEGPLRAGLRDDLNELDAEADGWAARQQAAPVETAPPGEQSFMPPVRNRSTTVPGGEFGAPRSYGGHVGRDYAAPAGTPVYPMAEGIAHVSHSKTGGNTVEIEMAGGWKMRVLHLQDGSIHIRDGQHVGVNDIIGGVGDTGTASHGDHAHVELYDPQGRRHDPAKLVGQRTAPPAPDGTRVDLQASYAWIDRQPWTEGRKARARQAVQGQAAQNDLVRSRAEQDADRAITQQLISIEKSGGKLTGMGQLDPNTVSRASPDTVRQLLSLIEANNRPAPVEAHGEVKLTLTQMSILDPERFKQTDLRLYQHQMTQGEFDEMAATQARMKAEPAHASPTANLRNEIDSTIRFYAPDIGFDTSKAGKPNTRERQQYLRIFETMQRHLRLLTDDKRPPTNDEMKRAFDRATVEVVSRGKTGRIYELDRGSPVEVSIPLPIVTRIVNAYKQVNGRSPTSRELQLYYLDNIGRPGFW